MIFEGGRSCQTFLQPPQDNLQIDSDEVPPHCTPKADFKSMWPFFSLPTALARKFSTSQQRGAPPRFHAQS
jgi:hypothetical protein